MEKFWTVKEVCELTGLKKKTLFDYDKQGIVKPSDYRTNGYIDSEGNVYHGHKLYNEDALIKLQQIAIFKELGLERKDIKKRITASDYDVNKSLEELSELLREKRDNVDKMIFMVEQLKMLGLKNGILTGLRGQSLSVINANTEKIENTILYKELRALGKRPLEELESLSAGILEQMSELKEMEIDSECAMMLAEQLFEVWKKQLGFLGYVLLFLIVLSIEGEGTFVDELELSKVEARAIKKYFQKNIQQFREELVDLIIKHYDVMGADYEVGEVAVLVEEAKELGRKYFGISREEEFVMAIEYISINRGNVTEDYAGYILGAVKYYLEKSGCFYECMKEVD